MLSGALRSKGIQIGETKVGKVLYEINPNAQKRRGSTAGRSLNPKTYKADYFGHKIHFDQNEKLGMYGVVHVCARDGFSGMIIGHSTMTKKNNIVIYDEIYRHVCEYILCQYSICCLLQLNLQAVHFVLQAFIRRAWNMGSGSSRWW